MFCLDPSTGQRHSIACRSGLKEAVIESGKAVIVEDVLSDRRLDRVEDAQYEQSKVKSLMCVPICDIRKKKVLGSLTRLTKACWWRRTSKRGPLSQRTSRY